MTGGGKAVDSKGTIHYASAHYERNAGNGTDTTEKICWYASRPYSALLGPFTQPDRILPGVGIQVPD